MENLAALDRERQVTSQADRMEAHSSFTADQCIQEIVAVQSTLSEIEAMFGRSSGQALSPSRQRRSDPHESTAILLTSLFLFPRRYTPTDIFPHALQ